MSTYQLKISIKGIKPLIWRRVLTPSNILLSSLHVVIQIIMRWDDSHLHEFDCNGMFLGIPDEGDLDGNFPEIINYTNVSLDLLMTQKKDNLTYIYDFIDYWEVDIVLEDIILDSKIKNPQLVKGKMAAPPENCGGKHGFANMLRILDDPKDPEYQVMLVRSKRFESYALDIIEIQNFLDCWRFEYLRPKTEKQIKGEEDRIKRISELLNRFCDEKLNHEYKTICFELFEDLQNYTEIISGRAKVEAWACAIVQVVGSVHALFSPSSRPHLSEDMLYEWFGVKKSTVTNKMTEITGGMDITEFISPYTTENKKEKESFISIDEESLEWMKKQYRQDN